MADMIELTREKFANIANAIRNVTGETKEYTVDEMPSAIENIENPNLQEKIIYENGEFTPDEGYDGLSKVTVNVPITNSVSDGYMVNFFNANGEVVQVHSAKYGHSVDKPLSYDNIWGNLNGGTYTFPLILTEDSDINVLNLYPISDGVTAESVLYEHFGVSKSSYEWVIVRVDIPNRKIDTYFISAPTAPGNNYGVPYHIFSGNMRSPALVYTVNDVDITKYALININLLLNENSTYSTMSTLNIPFTLAGDILLYANYTNEAINVNLTNSYMPVELNII